MELIDRSKKIRKDILELCYSKKASHIGGSMSIVDILNYLYTKYLTVDPLNFQNPNRDRFYYSKGHACTALYCTLKEFNFFSSEDLSSFTDNGSYFTSHVNHKINGVELSTGSLGHALSVAVGTAYALKLKNQLNKVVCVLSDGELNEGSNWEALMFAAHHCLENLTIIIDYNKLQSFGRVDEVIKLDSLYDKFEAFNLSTIEIDGHNFNEIEKALSASFNGKAKIIIANTIKGKGVSFMENRLEWHYKSPNYNQLQQAIQEIYR